MSLTQREGKAANIFPRERKGPGQQREGIKTLKVSNEGGRT